MGDRIEKQTKAEQLNSGHFADAMMKIKQDVVMAVVRERKLPTEWDQIWRDPSHEKTRVTIRLDSDVVKFFRGFGKDWQPRANTVLRAFMHARIAKIVNGPDTTDFILRAQEIEQRGGHDWGDVADAVSDLRFYQETARLLMEQKRFVMEAEAYDAAEKAKLKRASEELHASTRMALTL